MRGSSTDSLIGTNINNTVKKGGDLIGKGAYGCVFDPPITCKSSRDDTEYRWTAARSSKKNKGAKKLVGKVFFDSDDFEKEKQLMELINTIDPSHSFTVPVQAECRVTQFSNRDLDNETSTKSPQCSADNLVRKKQLVYVHGGKPLNSYIEKNTNKFMQVMRGLTNAIAGLKQIHKHGYIHADIKPGNILYNRDEKKTFLIDFGLSTPSKEVYPPPNDYPTNFSSIMGTKYPYWPPEFLWWHHKQQTGNTLSLDSLYAIMNETYSYLGDLHIDMSVLNIDVKSNLYIFQTMMKHFNDAFPTAQAHIFAMKADVYSLGMTLLELYKRHIKEATLSQKNRLFIHSMKHIIAHMVDPNVFTRWTMNMVYESWSDLMLIEKRPRHTSKE